ncbi:MAG: MBL fold metallo-hydrolase [Gemmatimonadota bacterium]
MTKPRPHVILAPNPSAMTGAGTRTYIIGQQKVAIIDPGPHIEAHLDAIVDRVRHAASISILVTHAHADHAEGAPALAARLNTAVARTGARSATDFGDIQALPTPGHTPDHISYWWEPARAVFCGDLMMGGMDTALVASPEGNLDDYLASLRALKALEPDTIYPAHGAPFGDPSAAIDRYLAHREARIAQVRVAMAASVESEDELVDLVYGAALHPELRRYAAAAIRAYIDHIRESR